MKQLIVIPLYFLLSLVTAQNNLLQENTFDEFIRKSDSLLYTRPSEALTFANSAKVIAEATDEPIKLAKASYRMSKCYFELNQNKDALINLEFSIEQFEIIEDKFSLYNAHVLKGYILSNLGDDARAIEAYLKAFAYAKELKSTIYELSPLANIAQIKKSHKDFQEAILGYKIILKRLATLKEDDYVKVVKLTALMNIADAHLWLQQTDQAEAYNEKGLQNCSKEKMAWLYYPMLMNKAIIHYQRKEYDSCKVLTSEVQTFAEDTKTTALYFTALFYLGKSAYKLENYQGSIAHLQTALDSIQLSENVDINEKEIHEYLALNYNKTGNPEKSLFHFEKYSDLEKKQSLEDLKINNKTHQLVDMKPLQDEIKNLDKELHKETSSKKGWLMTAVSLLVLLMGSILFYILRVKRIRKKFNLLLEKVSVLEEEKGTKKTAKVKRNVSDDQMKAILDKISEFEDKEYFLEKDCSLGYVAEKLGTNTSYISKAINKYRGKSFTKYITELRINAALVKLKNDRTIQSYTIQAIAEEFGFKRQETFAKAFKQYTGIYPSQYIKNLKNDR